MADETARYRDRDSQRRGQRDDLLERVIHMAEAAARQDERLNAHGLRLDRLEDGLGQIRAHLDRQDSEADTRHEHLETYVCEQIEKAMSPLSSDVRDLKRIADNFQMFRVTYEASEAHRRERTQQLLVKQEQARAEAAATRADFIKLLTTILPSVLAFLGKQAVDALAVPPTVKAWASVAMIVVIAASLALTAYSYWWHRPRIPLADEDGDGGP